MNKKHTEFMEARRAIRDLYGSVTCSVYGVILIYKGVPVGELGWKYWAYKIIRYMKTKGRWRSGDESILSEGKD